MSTNKILDFTISNIYDENGEITSSSVNKYKKITILQNTALNIKVYGATGGYYNWTGSGYPAEQSIGGFVEADVTFNMNDEVYLILGESGKNVTGRAPSINAFYDSNGGYGGKNGTGYSGGAGTDIRLNGMSLDDRIIVAGGGGGSGPTYVVHGTVIDSYENGSGGHGGGGNGINGTSLANGNPGGGAGYGGTLVPYDTNGTATNSKGGYLGGNSNKGTQNGSNGDKGFGGNGGNGQRQFSNGGGGGGGGGYYGGGGGGGSSSSSSSKTASPTSITSAAVTEETVTKEPIVEEVAETITETQELSDTLETNTIIESNDPELEASWFNGLTGAFGVETISNLNSQWLVLLTLIACIVILSVIYLFVWDRSKY